MPGKLSSIRNVPAEQEKKITPVRDGRRTEYMAEVGTECVGIFDTYRKAEAAADEYVYTILTHAHSQPAAA